MAAPIPSRLTFVGTIRPGNTIEVRWITGHPMETGFGVDPSGQRVLRNVITSIRVTLDGRLLLEAEPGTGISANPFLAFSLVVPPAGGTLAVEWIDDAGRRGNVAKTLMLEP